MEGRDRTLSFHERATSKDVIDELNRMIRKGEENASANNESQVALEKLDLACCCPTGWVHVERDIDFTDPKVNRMTFLRELYKIHASIIPLEMSKFFFSSRPEQIF